MRKCNDPKMILPEKIHDKIWKTMHKIPTRIILAKRPTIGKLLQEVDRVFDFLCKIKTES